ncbi:hypothetical protein QBC32DRAFT_233844, partial [Pseudoneurospora amorphoporcata]
MNSMSEPMPSAIPVCLLPRTPSPPCLTYTSWDREKHLYDSDDKALALLPIQILSRDLSNYNKWLHALWFHIVYHRLVPFIMPQQEGPAQYRECPEAEDQDNWTRRQLHSYALVFYSIGRDVLEDMARDQDLGFDPFDDRDYWAHELMHKVEFYHDLMEERMASYSEGSGEEEEDDDDDDDAVLPVEVALIVELRRWTLIDGVFD